MQAGSLSSRKQLLAAIVAAGLLAAIFVPFQTAQAATVDYNTTDGDPLENETIQKSGTGLPLSIEITLGPGEFLDYEVPVTITPGLPDDPSAEDGTLVIDPDDEEFIAGSGTPASLLKDIVVESDGGAYGYGYAATNGFVGPVTITVNATLKTAFLHQGSTSTNTEQTLVLDINSVDFPVAFNVTGADNVVTNSISGNTPKTITTGSGKTITITPSGGNGIVTVAHESLSDLNSAFNNTLFDDVSGDTATLSIGTSEFFTIGDPFEIDTVGLTFPIEITFDYDPDDLPDGFSESDIVLLHFNETNGEWEEVPTEVDAANDQVTGTFDSLSPIVTGVNEADQEDDDDDDDEPRRRGGGGGTVTITWPRGQTFDPEYFINYPLQRMLVANSAFINAAGVSIDAAEVGQQVSISGEFTNQQESAQNYAYIVQVTDENDVVTSLSWQQGTLESGSTIEVSTLWTPEIAGTYTVKIFVWNSITGTPEPLSEVTVKNISVA